MTLYRVKSVREDLSKTMQDNTPVKAGDIVRIPHEMVRENPRNLTIVIGVLTEYNWGCCLMYKSQLEEIPEEDT